MRILYLDGHLEDKQKTKTTELCRRKRRREHIPNTNNENSIFVFDAFLRTCCWASESQQIFILCKQCNFVHVNINQCVVGQPFISAKQLLTNDKNENFVRHNGKVISTACSVLPNGQREA